MVSFGNATPYCNFFLYPITNAIRKFAYTSSIYTIVVLSLERYLSICQHKKAKHLRSPSKVCERMSDEESKKLALRKNHGLVHYFSLDFVPCVLSWTMDHYCIQAFFLPHEKISCRIMDLQGQKIMCYRKLLMSTYHTA